MSTGLPRRAVPMRSRWVARPTSDSPRGIHVRGHSCLEAREEVLNVGRGQYSYAIPQ